MFAMSGTFSPNPTNPPVSTSVCVFRQMATEECRVPVLGATESDVLGGTASIVRDHFIHSVYTRLASRPRLAKLAA